MPVRIFGARRRRHREQNSRKESFMLALQHVHTEFSNIDDLDKNVHTGQRAVFPKRVLNADAAMQGIRLQYDNGDHNVLLEQAGVGNVKWSGNVVTFDVFIGLRDQSQNPYSGAVMALIIADLADK
jgi:hypothetical protein